MSYQYGDRDRDSELIAATSKNVREAKEEAEMLAKRQAEGAEKRRLKMINDIEKLKNHYSKIVAPDIIKEANVRFGRKQMEIEDARVKRILPDELILRVFDNYDKQWNEISETDPEEDIKKYNLALEQKMAVDYLLKENNISFNMRKELQKFLHGQLNQSLSQLGKTVYADKTV